jgi:hypothetical protein
MLIIVQLVSKTSPFMKNGGSFIVFTTAHHWNPSIMKISCMTIHIIQNLNQILLACSIQGG